MYVMFDDNLFVCCSRSQVYCALTKHFVNRTHWHLERHVNGAKFQDAYRRCNVQEFIARHL